VLDRLRGDPGQFFGSLHGVLRDGRGEGIGFVRGATRFVTVWEVV